MRALVFIAIFAFGLAGIAAASAADLPRVASGNFSTRYASLGRRAGALVIYDDQPGVVVRAYWLAPWRHRHFYPTTGVKPEVGRDEDMSAIGEAPQRAQTYRRTWSASSLYLPADALPLIPNAVKP
jgi:hypothetical protein